MKAGKPNCANIPKLSFFFFLTQGAIHVKTVVLAPHGAFCKDQIVQEFHFDLNKDKHLISCVEKCYSSQINYLVTDLLPT